MDFKPDMPNKKETPVAIISIPVRIDQYKTVMFNESVHAQESSHGNTNTSSSTSVEMTPKRAKSEANREKSNIMMILSRARKNFARKLSPNKLDA